MATAESINARLAATLAPYEAQRAAAKQQYESQQKLLGDQLAARQQQVQARYDSENQRYQTENALLSQRLTDQNNRALQSAYIQAQQARKALPQQLAAQGLHGGMTETSMVRLNNNYQNNRNALDRDYQTNLADLNRAYQNSLADLRLNFDQNMGDLDLNYQEKLAALGNDYFARDQDIGAKIAAAKAQAQAELAELAAAEIARRRTSDGSGVKYVQANPYSGMPSGLVSMGDGFTNAGYGLASAPSQEALERAAANNRLTRAREITSNINYVRR